MKYFFSDCFSGRTVQRIFEIELILLHTTSEYTYKAGM